MNTCAYSNECREFSKYKESLDLADPAKQHYFLSVCSNGGSDICIKKQKSLEKKAQEE